MFRTCLILMCALCVAGCPDGKKRGRYGKRGGELVSVAAEAVRADGVRETLEGHAALEAEALVAVPCRVKAQVLKIHVEAGTRVKAEQVLAELDSTRAGLAKREAELRLAQAKTSLSRQRGLAKQGLAKVEDLEAAKEAVAQAELAIEQAELDLSETKIKSPIDGVVTERLIQVGDQPDVNALAFHIADRDPLLAKVRIPEAQAERVKVGQTAYVKVEGHSQEIRGKVLRVAPLVDMTSGTVVVTVAITEGTADLRLNRFATVEVVVEQRPTALTFPHAALAIRGEEDRVFVCEDVKEGERGKTAVVRLRKLTVGVRQGGRVEVREGLAEGDWVVTAAPDGLRDGTRVRVVVREPKAAGTAAATTAGKPGG